MLWAWFSLFPWCWNAASIFLPAPRPCLTFRHLGFKPSCRLLCSSPVLTSLRTFQTPVLMIQFASGPCCTKQRGTGLILTAIAVKFVMCLQLIGVWLSHNDQASVNMPSLACDVTLTGNWKPFWNHGVISILLTSRWTNFHYFLWYFYRKAINFSHRIIF